MLLLSYHLRTSTVAVRKRCGCTTTTPPILPPSNRFFSSPALIQNNSSSTNSSNNSHYEGNHQHHYTNKNNNNTNESYPYIYARQQERKRQHELRKQQQLFVIDNNDAFPYIRARQQQRLLQLQQQQRQLVEINNKNYGIEEEQGGLHSKNDNSIQTTTTSGDTKKHVSSKTTVTPPPSSSSSTGTSRRYHYHHQQQHTLIVPPNDLNPLLSVRNLNNSSSSTSAVAAFVTTSRDLLYDEEEEEDEMEHENVIASKTTDNNKDKKDDTNNGSNEVEALLIKEVQQLQLDQHQEHLQQQQRNIQKQTLEGNDIDDDIDDDIAPDIRRIILEYASKDPTPASLETLIRVGHGDDDASFWRSNNNENHHNDEGIGDGYNNNDVVVGEMIGLNNQMMTNRGHRLALLRILMQTARFLRREIPIRLAHRICDLDNVPMMNKMPAVRDVKKIYIDSFLQLIQSNEYIETASDEENFATLLSSLYHKHASVLVQMAKGAYQFREQIQSEQKLEYNNQRCRDDQYHDDESISMINFEQMDVCHSFLDRFYLSRIGIRVLAGQYLALRSDFQERQNQQGKATSYSNNNTAPHTHSSMSKDFHNASDYVGMICERTNTVQIVRQAAADATFICRRTFGGRAPMIHVHGNLNLTFPFIPTYLHYILLELLKNSLRATMERHLNGGGRIPPVTVIIADGTENEDVVIKIMDEGGGIPRRKMNDIWSYLYTTADPKIQKSFLIEDTNTATTTTSNNNTNNPHAAIDDQVVDENPTTKGTNTSNNKKATASLSSSTTTSKLSAVSTKKKDHGTNSPLAGLGYGLPISRDYCRYFGGDLDLISMEGFGTDAFIHLKRVGDSIEPVP